MKKIFYLFRSNINLILTFVVTLVFYVGYIFVDVDAFVEATWIYSASMQTLATMIALLPISYGYYLNNVDSQTSEYLDTYVVQKLKSDVYSEMMRVILLSVLVILINLLSFFISVQGRVTYVITYLTTVCILQISVYIYKLFNPSRVGDILKEFDENKSAGQTTTVTLDQFITEYLQLETEVKDFVSSEKSSELLNAMPLYDVIDVYSKDYLEIQQNLERFKEIIFHRNNVIHNYSEIQIDFNKYTSMLELKDLFHQINNQFIQRKMFRNVLSVKSKIQDALKEVDLVSLDSFAKVKEEVISSLHSFFVSEYYKSVSDEPNLDTDFEVVQSNYSKTKLLGIEVSSVQVKEKTKIVNSFFERFDKRYLFLFKIFYTQNINEFEIYYRTKDGEVRVFIVKGAI